MPSTFAQIRCRRAFTLLAAALVATVYGSTQAQQPPRPPAPQPLELPAARHLRLFYGNSYTMGGNGTHTVPELAEAIADAAGEVRPHHRTYDGAGGWRLKDNFDRNVGIDIWGFLPFPRTHWDEVVLQEFSTGALANAHGGNRALMIRYAAALLDRVRATSPGVQPVLYMTWARSSRWIGYGQPGNPASPREMNAEIRDGYVACAGSLTHATQGRGIGFNNPRTRIIWVGEAFAFMAWDPSLYQSDAAHPSSKGLLLIAATMYSGLSQAIVSADELADVAADLGLGSLPASELARIVAAANFATRLEACPIDFNRDGTVDADDLGDYITAFFASTPPPVTDFNRDGVIDADDLGDFITTYFSSGC